MQKEIIYNLQSKIEKYGVYYCTFANSLSFPPHLLGTEISLSFTLKDKCLHMAYDSITLYLYSHVSHRQYLALHGMNMRKV